MGRKYAVAALRKGYAPIANNTRKILRKWARSRPRTGKERMNKLAKLLVAKTSKAKRQHQFIAVYMRTPRRSELDSAGLGDKGYLPTAIEYGFKNRGATKFKGARFLRDGFDQKTSEAIKRTRAELGRQIDILAARTK